MSFRHHFLPIILLLTLFSNEAASVFYLTGRYDTDDLYILFNNNDLCVISVPSTHAPNCRFFYVMHRRDYEVIRPSLDEIINLGRARKWTTRNLIKTIETAGYSNSGPLNQLPTGSGNYFLRMPASAATRAPLPRRRTTMGALGQAPLSIVAIPPGNNNDRLQIHSMG